MADFNSDDLVFSEPEHSSPARNNKIGQKSIDRIFQHAAEDRISSKRVVQQLQFSQGAPSTRGHQKLWVRRFEAFRQALAQDPRRPYTGDDLIRFFDSILAKMDVVQGKPGPNVATIVTAVKALLAYGHFKWAESDGFKIGAHESARFQNWLDQAKRVGRLTSGAWKKRTWIGYAVLSRLVRAYLTRGIEHGTINWDITIAKCLSMVLVSSLGSRTGDIALSKGYKGKTYYLQYRHIELFIEGNEPIFANLRTRVTLEFEKGRKEELNDETIRNFRPLAGAHNSHMCAIALLLVHCLRHCLVAGTTLQEVLERAVQRSDRTIVWLFPERPVLTAFALSPLRCDLDKPAGTGQLLDTIREMGVVAGMLDRAHGHAIRLGASRDVAHLPAKFADGTGLVTENVRQSLGHKNASTYSGATDRYVGGSSMELYNARALSSKENKGREPRFMSLQGGETGPEARGQTSKTLAQVTPLPPSAQPRRPLAIKDVNAPSGSVQGSSSTIRPTISEGDRELAQSIDPATLDDDDIAGLTQKISEAAVQELQARILPTGATSGERELTAEEDEVALDQFTAADAQAATLRTAADDELEEETAILFDNADSELANASLARSEEFVARYARYNVVNNYYVGRHCQRTSTSDISQHLIDKYCMIGGSRDHPQPMLHHCSKTPSCPFSSFEKGATKSHEVSCTELRVEQLLAGADKNENEDLVCLYDDCTFVPAPASKRPAKLLAQHVQAVHGYETKACEHGCEPSKIYYNATSYRHHIDHAHSERWPTRCTFPGCSHDRTFAVHSSLKYHLRTKHNLNNEAMVPYIPPLPATPKWIPQACFIDGCNAFLNSRAAQTQHVRRTHQFSLEDAKAAISERAQFNLIVPTTVVGRKRAPSAKETEQALETDAPPSKKKKASSAFSE